MDEQFKEHRTYKTPLAITQCLHYLRRVDWLSEQDLDVGASPFWRPDVRTVSSATVAGLHSGRRMKISYKSFSLSIVLIPNTVATHHINYPAFASLGFEQNSHLVCQCNIV